MAVFVLREQDEPPRDAPAWFVDWVRLGMVLGAAGAPSSEGARRVIAVSAPSEAFATAALAFGYLRARQLRRSRADEQLLTSVEDISALAEGARIWFRLADRTRTARFLGWDDRGRFRTTNGHYQFDKVLDVRHWPEWMPEVEKQAPFGDHLDQPFVRYMLRGADPVDFATSWNFELSLIGSVAKIGEELQLSIAASADDAPEGAIAQLVRPFAPDHPLGAQSLISSSRDEDPLWARLPIAPRLTVLRGAYATSRWLPELSGGEVVCVLGRAEPGLDAAVAALMQARVYGDPIVAHKLGWTAPPSCEVLAFRDTP